MPVDERCSGCDTYRKNGGECGGYETAEDSNPVTGEYKRAELECYQPFKRCIDCERPIRRGEVCICEGESPEEDFEDDDVEMEAPR